MSNTHEEVLTGLVDAPVRIELESTPGSGAVWYPSEPPPTAVLEGRDARPAGEGVGGPAVQVFEFRAAMPGSYRVSFQLKRVWEGVVRRERHFVIHIAGHSQGNPRQ